MYIQRAYDITDHLFGFLPLLHKIPSQGGSQRDHTTLVCWTLFEVLFVDPIIRQYHGIEEILDTRFTNLREMAWLFEVEAFQSLCITQV